MMVFGFAQFAPFHVLHDDVKEVGIVVDFVDFDDVGVFKAKEDFAFVEEGSDILFGDSLFVDDFDCVLIEVFSEDSLFDFGKGAFAEQFLENVVVLNRFG